MTETMEYSAGRCRFRAWADFWVVSFPERIDTGVIGITDQNCIRKYSHFASRLYASGLDGLDIYAARYTRPGYPRRMARHTRRPMRPKPFKLPLSPVLIVNPRAVFGRDSAHSLKNGAVTQSYRIQHHIPARPCLRLAETLQGTSEAFVLPKTPARR